MRSDEHLPRHSYCGQFIGSDDAERPRADIRRRSSAASASAEPLLCQAARDKAPSEAYPMRIKRPLASSQATLTAESRICSGRTWSRSTGRWRVLEDVGWQSAANFRSQGAPLRRRRGRFAAARGSREASWWTSCSGDHLDRPHDSLLTDGAQGRVISCELREQRANVNCAKLACLRVDDSCRDRFGRTGG